MTMNITSDQNIAGHPAMKVRLLLRYVQMYDGVATKFIASVMDITDSQARRLGKNLEQMGFIVKVSREERKKLTEGPGTRYTWYRSTEHGLSLAFASAAPRIKRSTAEALISGFIDRVRQANEAEGYCYWITAVVLYGSALSGRQDLGDVDLAIHLTPRIDDSKAFLKLTQAKIQEAYDSGRKFRNLTEEVWFPRNEIRMFLKNRKRAISIHELVELAELARRKPLPYRVLLGDKAAIRELLGPNAVEV
jgi:predicted nucleotidyltransferase